MCRNIKPLFNFEPQVTDEEVRAVASETAFFAHVLHIEVDSCFVLGEGQHVFGLIEPEGEVALEPVSEGSTVRTTPLNQPGRATSSMRARCPG